MADVKKRVRVTIEYDIEVDEEYSSKQHIESYRNEGTYCWDSFIDELDAIRNEREEKGGCMCNVGMPSLRRPKFEVLE